MGKLNNILISFLTLGLVCAAYAEDKPAALIDTQSTAQNVSVQAAHTEVNVTKKAEGAKHAKKHAKKAGNGKKREQNKAEKITIMHQINLDALNQAPNSDFENAVGKKTADRIEKAKTKLNGKFTDVEELCKEARLGKKTLQKLVKAFPKN